MVRYSGVHYRNSLCACLTLIPHVSLENVSLPKGCKTRMPPGPRGCAIHTEKGLGVTVYMGTRGQQAYYFLRIRMLQFYFLLEGLH